MRSIALCWVCLLSASLPLLLLLWFGHVIQWEDTPPAVARSLGLDGYLRILPGSRADQYLHKRCNHCALVSSSGHMLGASLMEEIDQTECVIRMNNAPTVEFEKDVGSRTSVRVASHTSVPLLLKNERYYFQQSENTTYVFWGPERNMRRDGKGRVFNALLRIAERYPNAQMFSLTKERVQYCDKMFRRETGKDRMETGAFLSTGFFTMILAIDMCDSIHVYGMVDDGYCSRTSYSGVPYHYYEKNRLSECKMYRVHEHTQRGGHRFITEKAIFARWATQHKIEFKHPSWNL